MSPRDPEERGAHESSRLFREEALEHYRQGYRLEGDVLRISPAWLNWTAWLLLLVGIAATLFAVFGSVHEHVTDLRGRHHFTPRVT